MSISSFHEAPFFVNGDVVKSPVRGTPCVVTTRGVLKKIVPKSFYTEGSEEGALFAGAQDKVINSRLFKKGEMDTAVRDTYDLFFDLYDPPELSLYPGALNAIFDYHEDGHNPICIKRFRGKWQRAIYNVMESVIENNTLVFRKYVFDSRVERETLVNLVLENPVFYDWLSSEREKDTHWPPATDLGKIETWQARKNLNRAIDALVANGVFSVVEGGLLQCNILAVEDPKKEAIQDFIDQFRLYFCFFPAVVDLRALA